MARFQIDSKDLPTAIAWETARANVLENWGFDAQDIRALADKYARRLMELSAESANDQEAA